MRDALTADAVDRLQATARTAKAHRRAAAELALAADHPHPDDDVSPAELLSAAGWHVERAGEVEDALELHRRAVTAEGTATPDARCMLVAALLEAGRPDEARQVAEELRRAGARVVDAVMVTEVFELAGDLEQAHRWVAIGMSRLDRDGDDSADYAGEYLFRARTRIREALGFPPDA